MLDKLDSRRTRSAVVPVILGSLFAVIILSAIWWERVVVFASSGAGIAIGVSVVSFIFKRPTFAISFTVCPVPAGDYRRTIIRSKKLAECFEIQPKECASPFQDGWRFEADGQQGKCIARYVPTVSFPFSIVMQVKPLHIPSKSATHYWRVGFVVFDEQDKELVCFHVGSPSWLCARANDKYVLVVPTTVFLENTWSVVGLEVGQRTFEQSNRTVFGHFAGQSYFLGNYDWPSNLKVAIQAWSDDEKEHRVLVRDLSFYSRKC